MNYLIINEITDKCVNIVLDYYNNKYISFFAWLSSCSDCDFIIVYENTFKNYFPDTFKSETSVILNYYAINLSNAIWSFYEIERNIDKLNLFIKKFINCQFKDMGIYQLRLNGP